MKSGGGERTAQQRIGELERAVGRKQMAIEIFEAAQDEIKKTALVRRVAARTEHSSGVICETLGIGRATAYRPLTARAKHCTKDSDRAIAAQITTVVRERASYGYRRITVVVNRAFGTRYNRKRVGRVMAMHAWTLQTPERRCSTRPHTGLVQRPRANERWSSDALVITCWNGEVVDAAFALGCCDRECLAWVAAARAGDCVRLGQRVPREPGRKTARS